MVSCHRPVQASATEMPPGYRSSNMLFQATGTYQIGAKGAASSGGVSHLFKPVVPARPAQPTSFSLQTFSGKISSRRPGPGQGNSPERLLYTLIEVSSQSAHSNQGNMDATSLRHSSWSFKPAARLGLGNDSSRSVCHSHFQFQANRPV